MRRDTLIDKGYSAVHGNQRKHRGFTIVSVGCARKLLSVLCKRNKFVNTGRINDGNPTQRDRCRQNWIFSDSRNQLLMDLRWRETSEV
jgi:hypothetical protein